MAENPKVKVYLFGDLQRWSPSGDAIEADASAGTVAALIEAVGVPRDSVGLAVLNGEHVPLDTPVKPGDEVGLFPPRG